MRAAPNPILHISPGQLRADSLGLRMATNDSLAFSAKDLVARGYFPRELPPVFTSRALGQAWDPVREWVEGEKKPGKILVGTDPAIYNLARQGTLRRRLEIPHPLAYSVLCHRIEGCAEALRGAAQRSPWSVSTPVLNPDSNARALRRSLADKIGRAHV